MNITGIDKNTSAGIRLGNNGLVTDGKTVTFTEAPPWRMRHSTYPLEKHDALFLKLKNFRKDISFWYSIDGMNWNKFDDANRSHDSYRISVFAFGEGNVTFDEFKYIGLE